MAVRSLLRCRALTSAWLLLHAVAHDHDAPQPLLATGSLEKTLFEGELLHAAANTVPFSSSEEPFTEVNIQAVNYITDPNLLPDSSETALKMGWQNLSVFRMAQAEVLICVCSYGSVISKASDPNRKWLETADDLLSALLKRLASIGGDGAGAPVPQDGQLGAPQLMSSLGEEEAQLCLNVHLLKAWAWEVRGDLAQATTEVLGAMALVRRLATEAGGVKTSPECHIGNGNGSDNHTDSGDGGRLRSHPGARAWMALRRRMVHLLLKQGQRGSTEAHIAAGLRECDRMRDDLTRIDLLTAKVQLDVRCGKLIEFSGKHQLGAIPTAQLCLSLAAQRLPKPSQSVVRVRLLLCLLLQQNPLLWNYLGPYSADEEAHILAAATGKMNADPNEQLVLEAQGKNIPSPLAKVLLSSRSGTEENKKSQSQPSLHAGNRACQLQLTELLEHAARDLDWLLEVNGVDFKQENLNKLFNFGKYGVCDGDEPLSTESEQPKTFLPVLEPPSLRIGLKQRPSRQLPPSDSRVPPSIYMEMMPLRLHCDLWLSELHLANGDLLAACHLLRDAEERMGLCVHLLPWLYVKFCVLKLQWRRLSRQVGAGPEAVPLNSSNHVKYSDSAAFSDGICPSTDSPLYRTFLEKAGAPQLIESTNWLLPANEAGYGEGLKAYVQQLHAVAKLATREGGHDSIQLLALFREGLEEVLWTASHGLSQASTKVPGLIYAFFECLKGVAEARGALLFESPSAAQGGTEAAAPPAKDAKSGKDAKGGAAGGVQNLDVADLPQRSVLEICGSLRCQGRGTQGLAYSPAALQDMQKQIPFTTVLRHALALRRECDTFGSLIHSERLLCDQLHVNLADNSTYMNARMVNKERLERLERLLELEVPAETVPTTGDIFIHWIAGDSGVSSELASQALDEQCSFILLACPLPDDSKENQILVARSSVHKHDLRLLWDGLCKDVEHCRPAQAITTDHVAWRLCCAADILTGKRAAVDGSHRDLQHLDAAQQVFLAMEADNTNQSTADSSAAAGTAADQADAKKVQGLLAALSRLLHERSSAAHVSHPALCRFLRLVLSPVQVELGLLPTTPVADD